MFDSIFDSDSYSNDELIGKLSNLCKSDLCENEDLFFILLALDKYLSQSKAPVFSENLLELKKDLLTFEETAKLLQIEEILVEQLILKNSISRTYLSNL